MNFKKVIFYLLVCTLFCTISAQENLLNKTSLSEKEILKHQTKLINLDKPLAYGYIDDRDVLWSKIVWEYIDLNQKINLPYYYPTQLTNENSKRLSLFETLIKGIEKNEITEIYEDDYFDHKTSLRRIKQSLTKIDTTDIGIDKYNFNEPLTPDDLIITELNATDIEGFKIKGMYYFDKRQGEIKYRLLGIAPCAPDVNFVDYDPNYNYNINELVELFWVWYPNARETAHKMKVFNPKNSHYPLSYDMLLNNRRFNAIIYKEENIYGDREVASYINNNALFQILESHKLRENIRNFELDMWNY